MDKLMSKLIERAFRQLGLAHALRAVPQHKWMMVAVTIGGWYLCTQVFKLEVAGKGFEFAAIPYVDAALKGLMGLGEEV
jgi:hypothetical protein